jgi:putative ABC transport system permease protein
VSWLRFFRRRQWDDERRRELESYLEMETEENVERGLSPDAARQAALRKLGAPTHIREEIYDMNTVAVVDHLWQDLRYAARGLRLNKSFATVAVLSLALGVGANTAIFQLVNAVRLRTLPVDDPSGLAQIGIKDLTGVTGRATGRYPRMSNAVWERIRDRAQGFSSTAAWATATFDLADGGEVRNADGIWVSGDFFKTLGVQPALGRLLTPQDDVPGCASPGVVVSHSFWQRELGGDPSAIGRLVRLDGQQLPIVGVTAAGFHGVEVGRSYGVAVPLCAHPQFNASRPSALERSDWWLLSAFGRLRQGTSREEAGAQLAAISPAIFAETVSPNWQPDTATKYRAHTLGATPGGTGFSGLRSDYEKPLWVLLIMTALVLLIACANLANLMLARATAREREIAVRLAIGASRGRIVRQLMAESVLLAMIGAAAGAVLAHWLSAGLVAFLTTESNRMFVDLGPDPRVLGFATGLALLTCVLFGLAPALRATHVAPGVAMKANGRGLTAARERFGLRRFLVVAQMAFSLVLVTGAFLFAGTLRNLMTVDPGFRPHDLIVLDIDMQRARFPEERLLPVRREILERLRQVPGVVAVGQAEIVPMSGSGWNQTILVDGRTQDEICWLNRVSPGYFESMGTPVLRGRDFEDRDDLSAPPAAIVNETFVRTYLGGREVLGQVFQTEEAPGQPRPLYQIVGVVKDTKYYGLREDFKPIAYLSADQETVGFPGMAAVVRTSVPAASLRAAVGAAIRDVHPQIALGFDTMQSQVWQTVQTEALMATLTGSFGVLAGAIAAVGLYGVMSYLVTRRRNEIGIRMALGADRRAVVKMIVRESAVLLGLGVAVGAVLAVAAGKTASALLYGLSATDPATMAQAAAVLLVVAVLATWVPAERAARIDPMRALREE